MANEVEIVIKTRDQSKTGFDSADRGATKLSGSMKKLGAVIAGAFVFDTIRRGFMDLIHSAEESQQVGRQTEATIRSMGGAAGVTAKQVGDLAEKLSEKTGIDDELIQSGENVLMTFRNVRNEVGQGNDIFDRATAAALDMSVALGQDLSSANIMLGKALNDPVAGITAMTRAGVSFTQEQKNMIRALVESGDILSAQKIILAEMESQFGGSAEAQATASQKMAVAWGNLKEEIGATLLPVFETATSFLSDFLPSAAGKATLGLTGLAAAVIYLAPKIKDAKDALESFGLGSARLDGRVGSLVGTLARVFGIVTVVGLAGAAISSTIDRASLSVSTLENKFARLAQSGVSVNDVFRETEGVAGRSVSQLGELADAIRMVEDPSNLERTSNALEGAASAVFTLGNSTTNLEQSRATIDAYDQALANLAETNLPAAQAAYRKLKDALIEQGLSQRQVIDQTQAYHDVLSGIDTEQRVASHGADGLSEAFEGQGVQIQAAEDALSSYMDRLRGMFDPLFAMQDALVGNQEAQARWTQAEMEATAAQNAYNEAVAQHGPNSTQAAEASMALMEAQASLTAAEMAGARATVDLAGAQETLRSKVESGEISVQDAKDELYAMAIAAGYSRERALRLAAGIDTTTAAAERYDGAYNAHVSTSGVGEAIGMFGRLIAAINSVPRNIAIGVTTAGASIAARAFGGHAHGGVTGAAHGGVHGGWKMVGEHGRELVKLPAGTRVMPNNETEQMLDYQTALADHYARAATGSTLNTSRIGRGGMRRTWDFYHVRTPNGGRQTRARFFDSGEDIRLPDGIKEDAAGELLRSMGYLDANYHAINRGSGGLGTPIKNRGWGGGAQEEGRVTVNVYVQGSIMSDRELIRVIRDEALNGGFRGAF